MSTITVEDVTGVVPQESKTADVRTFSEAALALLPKRLRDKATINEDGSRSVILRDDQPRTYRLFATVNGRADASVALPRSVLIEEATSVLDAAGLAAFMTRFPASGEPSKPKTDAVPAIAAAQKTVIDHLLSRSLLSWSGSKRTRSSGGTLEVF